MTKYPMVEHEVFIAAMEQLIQNYEAKRGTSICILCETAIRLADEPNYCNICPWNIITAEYCLDHQYSESEVLGCIIGCVRLYPAKYPIIVTARIAELHEWIELYRADLAKQ